MMRPYALPGVESEFAYGGWTPIYSGFSLYDEPFDTSFGMGDADPDREMPDLPFNLVLDRDFAGPFFEHVVFFLAVAIILFGLLVLTTSDAAPRDRFHVTTATALTAASGLLFAVILKHSQPRTVVGSPGVTYLEAIPMLLYAFIERSC